MGSAQLALDASRLALLRWQRCIRHRSPDLRLPLHGSRERRLGSGRRCDLVGGVFEYEMATEQMGVHQGRHGMLGFSSTGVLEERETARASVQLLRHAHRLELAIGTVQAFSAPSNNQEVSQSQRT